MSGNRGVDADTARVLIDGDGGGAVAVFELGQPRRSACRDTRARLAAGQHNRGQFFRRFFLFFGVVQHGKVVIQHVQCGGEDILELFDVAAAFFFVAFRRRHVGELDKEAFRLRADRANLVDFVDRFGEEGDIVPRDPPGFGEIIEEVFDGDQGVNHRDVGLGENLIVLQGEFGKEQAEVLQLRGQFFQPGQHGDSAVMHELRRRFAPGLLLLDGFVVQHFFAQCFKKAPPQLAGVVYQFFDFEQARMCRLRLHGLAEIIGLADGFVVFGVFQRFLHEDHRLGNVNPLCFAETGLDPFVDLLQEGLRRFQVKHREKAFQILVGFNDVRRIERRFRIADVFFNLVAAGFDDFVNFRRQRLIGFFADKRPGGNVYGVLTDGGDACYRRSRLDNGLPVVLAEMIKALDVVGQHQKPRRDFRAVSGKGCVHTVLRHALAQSGDSCTDGLRQCNGIILPHQGQAAADFREFVAQDVNAAGFGAFQPFDELTFDGGDVAPHFIPDTRQ